MAIKYEDVDLKLLDLTLQAYFKRYTYIEKESQVFWNNLEYSLPLNKMGNVNVQLNNVNLDNDDHLDGNDIDRINVLPN